MAPVVFVLHFPYHLHAGGPSGKSPDILIVDIDVRVYLLSGFTAIFGYILRIMVVDAGKGDAVFQQPVDGLQQPVSGTTGPDDDLVPLRVERPECLPRIRLFTQNDRVVTADDRPVKIHRYDHNRQNEGSTRRHTPFSSRL